MAELSLPGFLHGIAGQTAASMRYPLRSDLRKAEGDLPLHLWNCFEKYSGSL